MSESEFFMNFKSVVREIECKLEKCPELSRQDFNTLYYLPNRFVDEQINIRALLI